MSEWKPELDSIERQADYLVSLKIAERLAQDTIPKTQRKEGKEPMRRLIDADTAFGVLADYYHHSMPIQYMALKEALDRVPTVEAVPERKKGRWIPEFDGNFTGGAYWFSCSKCKRIVPEVRNGGWNFCPNCGASMTEGAEDAEKES